jgi:hypothetical protein
VRELAAMKRLPETIIYRILYQKNWNNCYKECSNPTLTEELIWKMF